MAIPRYLAMTAAEIQQASPLPHRVCWMSCLFSPYTTALSNLPKQLPPQSLVMVTDLTPINGHDPDACAAQLIQLVKQFHIQGIVFDFQRPEQPDAASFLKAITAVLPCPCAISEPYAADASCPVFVSPPPLHASLEDHLKRWQEREIWLELAAYETKIILTEAGSEVLTLPSGVHEGTCHEDRELHCHYSITLSDKDAHFQLWRTATDLDLLLEEAEQYHVTNAIGLYQEFESNYG